MFNEISGLGGPINIATSTGSPSPIWAGQFATRKEWKRAGKPGWRGTNEGPDIIRPPGTGPRGDKIDTGAGQVDQTPVKEGGIADFLSGIPSSWLLIGGVILLVVILKK